MKSNRLTHHPLIRFSFVALVIIFNIYFGITIFEHWSVDDGIAGRGVGTLLTLFIVQGLILVIYDLISDIWKWIWKYEV